jgi:AbrB family looped-hinge helix DNA binding protein
MIMSEATVKVDEKGRVLVPKKIRETAKLKEGSYVTIKTKGESIIIEPAEPVADKYYGAFKITNWPEDIDEFTVEVMQKWWDTRDT